MIDAILSRLPTGEPMPLTKEERTAIQGPLEQVLFKYEGAFPCEWQLIGALVIVGLPRYSAVKKHRAAEKAKAA